MSLVSLAIFFRLDSRPEARTLGNDRAHEPARRASPPALQENYEALSKAVAKMIVDRIRKKPSLVRNGCFRLSSSPYLQRPSIFESSPSHLC